MAAPDCYQSFADIQDVIAAGLWPRRMLINTEVEPVVDKGVAIASFKYINSTHHDWSALQFSWLAT